MKDRRKIGIGGVCMALIFTACAPGDSLPVPLEVSAEIGQSVTRADDTHAGDYDKRTFDTGDQINITKGSDAAVIYQRKAAGGWEPGSGVTALTTTGGETFTASFPTRFTAILADQSTATNFWLSNQLTATGVLTGNKCNFVFAPAAAKVTVVVKLTNAQTPESASLSGTGIRTNGGADETVTPYCTSGGTSAARHTYVAIVYPGSRTFTIKIKMTGDTEKSYTDASAFELKAGYNYQYNFSATDELVLTGVTVTPFTEEPETNAGSAT